MSAQKLTSFTPSPIPSNLKRQLFKFAGLLEGGALINHPDIGSGFKHFRSFKFGSIEVAGAHAPEDDELSFIDDHFGEAVALTPNSKLLCKPKTELNVNSLFIEDYHSPTLNQFLDFLSKCLKAEKNERNLFVHCAAGAGRTGTMLAFLVLYKNFARLLSEEKPLPKLDEAQLELKILHNQDWFVEHFKAHPFVVQTISDLRNMERTQLRLGGAAISVETQNRANALELQFRAMITAERLNRSEVISSPEIRELLCGEIPHDQVDKFYGNEDRVEVVKHKFLKFLI